MVTLMLSLLAERVMSICTTAPALATRSSPWKRCALMHGVRCYSSLIVFQAALHSCYEECFAIATGTTPLVKVIMRKRFTALYAAMEQLSADLIQLDGFFPPYPNPLLFYTLDLEEKRPLDVGIDLWLLTCPHVVLDDAQRATSCIRYATTVPTIHHVEALSDQFYLFPEHTIGEQTRQWGTFKTQPLPDAIAELRQAVRSQLSYHSLRIDASQQTYATLQTTPDAIRQFQSCRQAFATLLQQHFALESILE